MIMLLLLFKRFEKNESKFQCDKRYTKALIRIEQPSNLWAARVQLHVKSLKFATAIFRDFRVLTSSITHLPPHQLKMKKKKNEMIQSVLSKKRRSVKMI